MFCNRDRTRKTAGENHGALIFKKRMSLFVIRIHAFVVPIFQGILVEKQDSLYTDKKQCHGEEIQIMILDWIQYMDTVILLFIQEHMRAEVMHGFWRAVTSLGNVGWFWILTSLLLMVNKKTRRAGIAAFCSIALGALITNLALKNLVDRTRPYEAVAAVIPLIPHPLDSSFPSGHTCASFAAALIYIRMLPKSVGIATVVLAALIAFSRLYLGVHYPSDVLGGFLVACVASTVVYRIAGRVHVRKKDGESWV